MNDFARSLRLPPTLARGLLIACILTFYPVSCMALTADEILVVSNRNTPYSSHLAGYYMKKRAIPRTNIFHISATRDEHCTREEYDKKIAFPIRSYLEKIDPRGSHIRCLLLMFGVPLKISESPRDPQTSSEMARLEKRLKQLQDQLKKEANRDEEYLASLRKQEDETQSRIRILSMKTETAASVDSELALVRQTGYSLSSWIPNPHFLGFQGKTIEHMPSSALLVSRLDGPSLEIVRQIIDESVKVERDGLKGKAYFDARWPDPGKKELSGYAFYDASLHRAAERVRAGGSMPVVVDDKERLFQPGDCDDAALYCGWYSLGNYVDAFKWVPGSIGYHIASVECQTLKKSGQKLWCKTMLEKGVAATIGPVGEPYVQSFPVPEIFFGLLVEGKLTLAECYGFSVPFWSWKMVLVGDPLYRPFRSKAK